MAKWKNSAGQAFEIKGVPPYIEDEVRLTVKFPTVPTYKIETPGPDGEVSVYYEEYNAENISDESVPPVDLVKWKKYLTQLDKANAEFFMKFTRQVVIDGVVAEPDKEWLADRKQRGLSFANKYDTKYAYILSKMITCEDDLLSLVRAINGLRQISAERIKQFEDSFRRDVQSSPAQATAEETAV